MEISVKEIEKCLEKNGIGYKYIGDRSTAVKGFSAINNYKNDTITWIGRKEIAQKYHPDALLVIVQDGLDVSFSNTFICDNSKKGFFTIIETFFNEDVMLTDAGRGTYIGDNVELGENVKIGHNCTIDGNVEIGDNTVIHHNVTIINKVKIGANCEIQSGVRIGHDGFAYSEDKDGIKTMIKHHGGVIIHNDVFIGSNTEVARGTIDDTVINEGCKIDALSHIAHNVKLGKNNGVIAGCTIYGSVRTGDNCYIATSVIRDQAVLGNNVFVGMNSTVTKDIPDNSVVVGSPAKVIRTNK